MDEKYKNFFQNRLMRMGFNIMVMDDDKAMDSNPCISCCFMRECGGQKELTMLKNCRTFLRFNRFIDDRNDISDPRYEEAIAFINNATENNIRALCDMETVHG